MLKNRVGERKYNNSNLLMEIIEYRHANDIDVLFESGYTSKTRYSHFKTGNVKDFKEKSLRKLIEPYKNKIPSKVFEVLLNYKITMKEDLCRN